MMESIHPLFDESGGQSLFRLLPIAAKDPFLFEQPGYRMAGPLGCWDISPDGKRFLMVKLDDRKPQPVNEIILVQNWTEELKRLVPAK